MNKFKSFCIFLLFAPSFLLAGEFNIDQSINEFFTNYLSWFANTIFYGV